MLEQSISKSVDSTERAEPSENPFMDLWSKPGTEKRPERMECPIPPLELGDRTTSKFVEELKEAFKTDDFGKDFVDAAKKLAGRCKSDPDFLQKAEKALGCDIQVSPDGIKFVQHESFRMGSRSSSLEVDFKTGEVTGHRMSQAGCNPPREREVAPQSAAQEVFPSLLPLFPIPPRPFPPRYW